VELLENLMTMVSELVLSRNQLLQMIRGREDSEFTVPLQRLSHVTTELQEGVMKTRMQPIGNAWAKLPRIVRDLSHELHKKIDLQMNGAETELDRQVLELIKDPLTHMVRNSADHGLETTEERLAAGKPETGKVVLNAYHEGGHINIEITDDGRGIPVDKIKAKALEKGLASGADLEEMSDQRILQFIFNAGFSTAEKVTSVSGRGVGMDVVRSNIEKIGGTVDVKSVEGKGSVFTIKIPLTLAIVSALIVECAEERFAIPQLSVVELVRASKDGEHKIERINGTPVLRLRDRLLPLVYLDKVLGLRENLTAPGDDEGEAADTESMEEAFIVVSQIGSQTFGLVVDQVFDTEEIVVKPVAPILRDTKIFSGNTILGDGTVIMILDPNGISNMHVSSTIGEDHGEEDARQRAYADDLVALLVFHVGNQEPKAVPLSLVARLEEVDVKDIEHSDGQMMVQYRGRLMPLVKFDPSYEVRSEGRQPMLVFADGERSMGLIVDEIVDIVEEALDIELVSKQERLIGSAVVGGKATEIIDVAYYLTSALGDWFSEKGASSGSGGVEKNRILLVDDSPFFRNMLVPLLNVAGYQVTTAGTADEALELRDSGQHFDVIISDIEMPGMNGFEFAEAVKTDTRWDDTPLVALSSHTTPQDFDRGRQAGFVDYVSKTNRDALLDVLSQTLAVAGGAA
jgi:two-component system chemotaxis sensor kinase CheA